MFLPPTLVITTQPNPTLTGSSKERTKNQERQGGRRERALQHKQPQSMSMSMSSTVADTTAAPSSADAVPSLTVIPLHVRVDDQSEAQVLRFQCDWDVGIGGSIWTSGQILAEHLQLQQKRYGPLFQGKRVVELGSGTGYVGLMTAVCFEPASVYLTDLASHVACLERNVALNASVLRPGVRVHVTELAWGSASQETALLSSFKQDSGSDQSSSCATVANADAQVDIILGTDVAYLRELYEPLLHTLRHIATAQTLILLGLNRADTGVEFFERLAQDGFEYYKIPDEQLHGDYHGKDFGLFEIRRCKSLLDSTRLAN